jgi:hypothetical protein
MKKDALAEAVDEVFGADELPTDEQLERGIKRAVARSYPDTDWAPASPDWPQHWDYALAGMRPLGRSVRWRNKHRLVVCEVWPIGHRRPAGWIASADMGILSDMQTKRWVFDTEAEARKVADDLWST